MDSFLKDLGSFALLIFVAWLTIIFPALAISASIIFFAMVYAAVNMEKKEERVIIYVDLSEFVCDEDEDSDEDSDQDPQVRINDEGNIAR